jgi:hypothetical protein
VTVREERAARQRTIVFLNLYQLESVLAAIAMSGVRRDPDLNAAVRKLGRAKARRERAVKRAGGGR